MSDIIRQTKIKTSSLKRITKELKSYEKEKNKEEERVEKMKADGAPPHDIKQAEHVLQESAMMIPETRQRLESALHELMGFLANNKDELGDCEEVRAANEAVADAEEAFKT